MWKIFKVIRTLLKKDRGNNVNKNIDIIINNNITCDPKTIATCFKHYFIFYHAPNTPNPISHFPPL